MMNIMGATILHYIAFLAGVIIALTGGTSLLSPVGSIIDLTPTLKAWMIGSGNVLRSPLAITFIVTKKMFTFSVAATDIFFCNWLTAIRTWRSSFAAFFFGVFPTQHCSAFTGASYSIMYK